MSPDQRHLLMANTACVAVEAFIARRPTDQLTAVLLEAAKKYYDEITAHLAADASRGMCQRTDAGWVGFPAVVATSKAGANRRLQPKALTYTSCRKSSRTMRGLGRPRVHRTPGRMGGNPPFVLVDIRWQELSRSDVAQCLDANAAAVAAVAMVLQPLPPQGGSRRAGRRRPWIWTAIRGHRRRARHWNLGPWNCHIAFQVLGRSSRRALTHTVSQIR